MGQVLTQDNVPTLAVASTTSITIAPTNMGLPTRITIGGQQFQIPSTLVLNTSGTGANGLDSGVLSSIQLWYVYAVVNQTTFAVALVASQTGPATGPTMPAGYGTAYKLVGAFYTNGSSQVGSKCTIVGDAKTDWMDVTSAGWSIHGSSNGSEYTNYTVSVAKFFRDGDTLRSRVELTFSGTPGGGTGQIALLLPQAFQPDLTKINTPNNPPIGEGIFSTSASAYPIITYFGNANFVSSGRCNLYFMSNSGGVTATVPGSMVSGGLLTCDFYLPVSGWTTTLT